MTGVDVPQVFGAILPQQESKRVGVQCEVIGRQRRLHLGMLMQVMVIAAETPGVY
jgi:hypothetical protein